MSTPPSPYPGHPQAAGPYQQAPGPYAPAPGPYAPAPGPYQQAPGPYAPAPAPGAPQQPAPGPYHQPAPGPYQQAAPGPYQQAAPGPYQQAAPGPQHAAPTAPYPPRQAAPGAYGQAPAGPGCDVCGAAPAARVTVRGHQGMLIVMRNLWRKGTFCQTCALAVFRKMQSDTMVQGWWGPMSMLITPITLLINLFTLSRIRKMPPPSAPVGPGLDPGLPVLRRPAGIVGLFPLTGFAVVFLFVLAVLATA